MEKRLFQFVLFAVFLGLSWHFWNPLWRYDLNEAVDTSDKQRIVFDIEKGSSARGIAGNLASQDLIVNKQSFLHAVDSEELTNKLRYGQFVLSPSMTLREIIDVLTTQGTGEMALTVPEGWTIEDIDAALTDMGLIEAGDFKLCAENCTFKQEFLAGNTKHLEGFFFPDTYFIDEANFSVEAFANQMLDNFGNRITPDILEEVKTSGHSLYDILIVASMLEREVRTSQDLPIVSGIIWKRLENDWTLGIDATLLYTKDDNTLTAADLAKDEPYNTRLHKGLPPTAIGNPGLASIEAAIKPEASEYWFCLTDSEGQVVYGKTNEEHEANKSKYL